MQNRSYKKCLGVVSVIKLQFAWPEFVTRRLGSIRKKHPAITDEGIQQIQQEINAASAQTIISTNELNHEVNRLRQRARTDLDVYSVVVDNYSEIVKRALEINKEVFEMALGIKDDIKEVIRDRMDELKKGRSKGWTVAISMAIWLLFALVYILSQTVLASLITLPIP